MIVPGAIPLIEGNMDALAGHARTISTTGQAFAETGADIHNTWQGLYPHYIAPESGQLLSATGIVATTTASVGEDLGTAATALTTYADEVRTIQAALLALKGQAETLDAERAAAGEDWAGDSALVERDTQLIDAVNTQVAAFADAERRCANALRVLYGAPPLTADNGDGVLDPATEHGFTVEQLNAAARNGGTPWGATSEVDHPWPVDVLHNVGSFFGGLYQSGEDAVIGIGALVGIGEDGWSSETAGNAWGALGTLATGALVYGIVGVQEAERLDRNGSIPWLAPGAMGQSLEDAGKALIAYDQWDDDPARAAGATVGNVLLAVVGTKGAGAGLRAGGSAVGRIPGPVAARTSQALTGAGTTIGRIPTLTDVSRYARNTFPGFRSPDIRTPPIVPSLDAQARPPGSPGETGASNLSPGARRGPDDAPGQSASVAAAGDPPPRSESNESKGEAAEREPALVGATPHVATDSATLETSRSSDHAGSTDTTPVAGTSTSEFSTGTPPVLDSAGTGNGANGNMSGNGVPTGVGPHSIDGASPESQSSTGGHPDSSSAVVDDGSSTSAPPGTPADEVAGTGGSSAAEGFGQGAATHATPSTHRFETDQAAVDYGRRTWNEHVGRLPETERRAVFDYTVEPPHYAPTYKEINGYLRGVRPATPEILEHVRAIDSALVARPTPEALMVTRGADLGHLDVPPSDMKGLVITEDAYLSTSLGDNPVAAFADQEAVLHLRVPEGTPALWVEDISRFGVGERELLLGRGLSYHVDDVVRRDGQWHITGSIVSDG